MVIAHRGGGLHNGAVRSALKAALFLIYICALGAHPIHQPTPMTPSDLATSFVARDTDPDDDIVSTACLHCGPFDGGSLQNFDSTPGPKLAAFKPKAVRFVDSELGARDLLAEQGLFRPPRISLL
jgi:hypothetical protein